MQPEYRNISAWAIRNPIATVVLFLLLTVGGLVAFPSLRINNTPDIDLPAVVVTILQPGAAPSELPALAGILRRVQASGVSIVLVEHNEQLVRAVADRVLTMVEGRAA